MKKNKFLNMRLDADQHKWLRDSARRMSEKRPTERSYTTADLIRGLIEMQRQRESEGAVK